MKIEEARAIVAKYRPPYTQAQKAMRKAFGITSTHKQRRRRRKHAERHPSHHEMDECRRQRHGVWLDGE